MSTQSLFLYPGTLGAPLPLHMVDSLYHRQEREHFTRTFNNTGRKKDIIRKIKQQIYLCNLD